MDGYQSTEFPHDGAGDNDDSQVPSRLSQSGDGKIPGQIPPVPPSTITSNLNPDQIVVTGTASLRPDDIEGAMVASKLRHVHVLSQPGCESGKLHFSHNQVGDKTAMAIFEWANEDAFATWMLGKTSLQVWDQVVDFFKQNSIDLHRWKRLHNPSIAQPNIHGEPSSRGTSRALRAARLWDKAMNVDAYVALLWFRATDGQELMLIKTLWEIEYYTSMEPVGSSIRFDIHTGYDPDIEGIIMVYLAFENEQFFQQHLTKEYNIIGDRVCQYLDSSPLLTTWKTVDLSK